MIGHARGKTGVRRPAAVLLGLTLVGLVLVGLPGCAERPPPPLPVSAGMTRSAIRAAMGEPTFISQGVATAKKGWAPARVTGTGCPWAPASKLAVRPGLHLRLLSRRQRYGRLCTQYVRRPRHDLLVGGGRDAQPHSWGFLPAVFGPAFTPGKRGPPSVRLFTSPIHGASRCSGLSAWCGDRRSNRSGSGRSHGGARVGSGCTQTHGGPACRS